MNMGIEIKRYPSLKNKVCIYAGIPGEGYECRECSGGAKEMKICFNFGIIANE